MSDSEELRESAIGRRIRLAGHFVDPVTIESVDVWGEVANLHVRTVTGEPKDATVDLAELQEALASADEVSPTTFIDPARQFLLVESARVRLAYAWDPHFAVSLAGIEPLPHQLEAVYAYMLPQARLRYLLADDPGAGKTIMAGLLLKELRLRGAVDRVLILSPAPLTLQWQDELRSKFDETFEIIDSHVVRDQLGGSPWARFDRCTASMDFAKQEHIAPELLMQRWDLIVVDEAHKVSMPNLDKPTMRYKLVRQLADRTERLLLLTATPHQGNPAQFRNLLSLLDEHAFRSDAMVRRLLKQADSPWLLRRMKEDMRDFEGRKLFVKRHAYTEEFSLNEHEYALYRAVSDYIVEFIPIQAGKKKQSAALVRMVFQRRLASSLRAIRISMERRHAKLKAIVDELSALPAAEREQRLRELSNLPIDTEQDLDDQETEALDEAAQQAIMADRYDQLVAEVGALDGLVELAVQTEQRGQESKLDKLFECLQHSELKELEEAGGKLIIFTEQRATLDYLRENLERRGFRCCEIHGGMDARARQDAQQEFRLHKQICIATDAAGEGINLQFCHLMINYDMPWNPTRLEQRMGRIHRFGQRREVHVFNFVATSGPQGEDAQPVVEGRVLKRLFEKLDKIRDAIGDRVFDVIGLLLRLHSVNLDDVLRDATYNPRLLEDYEDDIERLDETKLTEYEQATGIALAKSTVDLSRIRGADYDSEEKRLMPEFVEEFFLASAKHVGLKHARRVNPALLRIEHVPQKFRARDLVAVRQRGPSAGSYPKASFHKSELLKAENMDGDLLSPGHPLYAAVDEILNIDLRDGLGGTGRYLDPLSGEPYRLHFFEVTLEGESLGDPGEPPRTVPAHARLVAVQENGDGSFAQAQPDVLHDLTPVDKKRSFPATDPWAGGPTPDELRRVESWIRAKVQHPLVVEHRGHRSKEVDIRREFLQDAFAASIKAAQAKQMELHGRVLGGDRDARLARDEAQRRLDELNATRDHRLRTLEHMGVIRSSRIAHLGSALVAPPPAPTGTSMKRDDEVEHFAYGFVIRHEEQRGWTVDEIYKRMDGSGFDLRSVSPPDEHGVRAVRRIEVKGRAAGKGEVHLSPNEWKQARRLRATFWLYVVWGCKTGEPRMKMIHDPWTRLQQQAKKVVEVKGYRVSHDALDQAEGEEWTG